MATRSQTIYINGRFLGKPITGTERFAREIVWAMDKLLSTLPDSPRVHIIAPPGTVTPEGLTTISFSVAGVHHGHHWEQWDLYRASRDGFLLNLTNSGPVLHSNQLTVIHDAMVFRTPKNYSFAYRNLHRLLGRLLARKSRIATVSAFSQGELARALHIKPESILIIPNGHEHILNRGQDDDILAKLGLVGRDYFFFLGSPTPNKNLGSAIEAFSQLNRPDASFVIVGAAKSGLFRDAASQLPANVIMPGRLTDNEITALYRHACALVFPSLYEGFGIPPLEAMTLNCPVLASSIPPVQEVCGDAALYFNPREPKEMMAAMQDIMDSQEIRTQLRAKGQARFSQFSWEKSAQKLLASLSA